MTSERAIVRHLEELTRAGDPASEAGVSDDFASISPDDVVVARVEPK